MTDKKQKLLKWLDSQIEATKLINTPFDEEDRFYIMNASSPDEKKVHIYGIKNLAKELHRHLRYEEHDDDYVSAYFTYKQYKFYGLVTKGERR